MSTPGRPLSPRVFRVGDYGHRPFRRRSLSQWSPGDQSFDEAAGVTRPAGASGCTWAHGQEQTDYSSSAAPKGRG